MEILLKWMFELTIYQFGFNLMSWVNYEKNKQISGDYN